MLLDTPIILKDRDHRWAFPIICNLSKLKVLKHHFLLIYLKERNLHESFFFKHFIRILFCELAIWIFHKDLFFQILVLSMLYIFRFFHVVLQLVVCESRNSYPIFLIFQIALFGYKRLNSELFDILQNIFDMTIINW